MNFDSEYFWNWDIICDVICKMRDALRVECWSPGSLVIVEKDLRHMTGLSHIQTAFRPRDSESTER